MSRGQEARMEWEKKIREKTQQVVAYYEAQSDGEVSLADALVGIFADHNVNREIPRVIVKDSEGKNDEGLIKVFDKILAVMRTPTFHTINYTHPEAVKLAEHLCLKGSITDGYAERDASYVLWEMVGERPVVYWDESRDLPQYARKIFETLNMQFSNIRVAIALREHKEFAQMLSKSSKIAYNWEQREDSSNGTIGMKTMDKIELGFATLTDYIPEESKDGENPLFEAIDSFCAEKNRERIPYRIAQYKLRGIPVSIGNNPY
jgi:hypothetical protein